MKEQLFLSPAKGEDGLYAKIRDDPRGKTCRKQLEVMWVEYRELAPTGFQRKFQVEFHQRWWEMYLAIGLIHLGLNARPPRDDEGPDLVVDVAGRRVWIEAVVPSIGTTSDRVPEPIMNGLGDYPKRECLLRLAQGLDSKQKALTEYVQESLIQPEEPCIVAISACNLNTFGSLLDLDPTCPAPLALLAGAGPMVVTRHGSREPYCKRQTSINRDSGSHVDTALYEKEDFRVVSGVLYSSPDPLNAPYPPEASFSLFLNPRANYSVPHDVYANMETWTEEQSGSETIWKKTQPANAGYVASLRA